MRRSRSIAGRVRTLAFGLAAFAALSQPGRAASVFEGEPDDSIATAQPVDALFDAGPCPGNPDLVPDAADPGPGFFANVETVPLHTGDIVHVEWCLHLPAPAANIAGFAFYAFYDPSELDLIHTGFLPPLVNTTPLGSPSANPFWIPASSTFPPLPPSSSAASSTRPHLAWYPPSVLSGSGVALSASTTIPLFSFSLQARHTSLSDAGPEFAVSEIIPVFHAASSFSSSAFLRWIGSTFTYSTFGPVFTGSIYVPGPYLGAPANYAHLGVVHAAPTPTATPSVTPTPTPTPEPGLALQWVAGQHGLAALGRLQRFQKSG